MNYIFFLTHKDNFWILKHWPIKKILFNVFNKILDKNNRCDSVFKPIFIDEH